MRLVLLAIAMFVSALAWPICGASADDEQIEVDPADHPDRPVPDYDGRGEEPATAGDALLWVPRIIVSPLYLLSEYLIRIPLGALVTWAEREELPELLLDFFTFGPDRNAGIFPTALVDFDLRSSVGLYAYGDDFLFDDNDLRVHLAWGGREWIWATITDRYHVDDHSDVALRLWGTQRPDYLFHGLGPDSRFEDEARYETKRFGARLSYENLPWRASRLWVSTEVESVSFDEDSSCCDEPSLQQQIDQGVLDAPPGWADDYVHLTSRLELAIDNRRERPAPGDGIRVELEGAYGLVVDRAVERRWMRYGGTVGFYWDPSGLNKVLSLSLSALFADPAGSDEVVPFTEQIQLGGLRYLRGFREGRLIGRSAAIARLEYRWPIWIWLDGTLAIGAGNVFAAQLDDFALDKLRMSFSLGLRTIQSRDQSLTFLVGFGTTTVDDFAVDSVRVTFGTTRGF